MPQHLENSDTDSDYGEKEEQYFEESLTFQKYV